MNTAKLKVAAVAVLLLAFVTIVLWQQWRTKRLLAEAEALREQIRQAGLVEKENHRQLQHLQAAADRSQADLSELLRLRGQSARIRQTQEENTRLKAERDAQAAESAQLRAWLATATQNLARAESDLSDAAKLSPEELQQLKWEAMSVRCVSNLKQICLAARLWAQDNDNVFPPNFVSLSNELAMPKLLFCPADATAIPVNNWWQLNSSTISYRLLNPNGRQDDPTTPLATCPIHGHLGLSDGSVHRQ